jgi:hypothetical protein
MRANDYTGPLGSRAWERGCFCRSLRRLGVLAASWALKTSENEVAGAGQFSFVAAAVQRNIPPGVEYLNTPSSHKDLIRFRGDLYLCGPSGLSAYDVDGRLLRNYRVGLEPAPALLVQMAARRGLAAASSRRAPSSPRFENTDGPAHRSKQPSRRSSSRQVRNGPHQLTTVWAGRSSGSGPRFYQGCHRKRQHHGFIKLTIVTG